MSGSLETPQKILLRSLPTTTRGFVFKIGKLYEQPGQICDVNTRDVNGVNWASTAFLLKTVSGRQLYGRPVLRTRDKHQQVVADTGIIVDISRALEGKVEPTELTVSLPGRSLGALTVGERCPWPEADDDATEWIIATSPADLEFRSEPPDYPQSIAFNNIQNELGDNKVAKTLWELATRCLQAAGQEN